jgi:hypothetical protein
VSLRKYLGKTLSEAAFRLASDLCNGGESVWMGT